MLVQLQATTVQPFLHATAVRNNDKKSAISLIFRNLSFKLLKLIL